MRTLFVNGRFWAQAPEAPEPRALLATHGRIRLLGAETDAEAAGARIVDLGGRTAIPGPVDAHCHLVSYGLLRLREADLRGAASLAEVTTRLREHARQSGIRPGDGRWLLGRGFEQDRFAERRWPTRADLDAISPEIPIRITPRPSPVIGRTGGARALGPRPAAPTGPPASGAAPARCRCGGPRAGFRPPPRPT